MATIARTKLEELKKEKKQMQIKGKQIDETMKLINRRTYEKHNDLFFGIFISRWYQVLNKRVSYSSNTPREYSLSLINFYLFVCVCVCVCVYVSVFVSAMSLTLNFCSALFSQKVGGIYIYVHMSCIWVTATAEKYRERQTYVKWILSWN